MPSAPGRPCRADARARSTSPASGNRRFWAAGPTPTISARRWDISCPRLRSPVSCCASTVASISRGARRIFSGWNRLLEGGVRLTCPPRAKASQTRYDSVRHFKDLASEGKILHNIKWLNNSLFFVQCDERLRMQGRIRRGGEFPTDLSTETVDS